MISPTLKGGGIPVRVRRGPPFPLGGAAPERAVWEPGSPPLWGVAPGRGSHLKQRTLKVGCAIGRARCNKLFCALARQRRPLDFAPQLHNMEMNIRNTALCLVLSVFGYLVELSSLEFNVAWPLVDDQTPVRVVPAGLLIQGLIS